MGKTTSTLNAVKLERRPTYRGSMLPKTISSRDGQMLTITYRPLFHNGGNETDTLLCQLTLVSANSGQNDKIMATIAITTEAKKQKATTTCKQKQSNFVQCWELRNRKNTQWQHLAGWMLLWLFVKPTSLKNILSTMRPRRKTMFECKAIIVGLQSRFNDILVFL